MGHTCWICDRRVDWLSWRAELRLICRSTLWWSAIASTSCHRCPHSRRLLHTTGALPRLQINRIWNTMKKYFLRALRGLLIRQTHYHGFYGDGVYGRTGYHSLYSHLFAKLKTLLAGHPPWIHWAPSSRGLPLSFPLGPEVWQPEENILPPTRSRASRTTTSSLATPPWVTK